MPHMAPHVPFMAGIALALVLLGGTLVWLVMYYRRPMAMSVMPARTSLLVTPSSPSHMPSHAALADVERDTLLVIPDITGYTTFMTQSRFALRHAQFVVTELLDAMASSLDERLRLCMPEGDALLLYAPLGDETDARDMTRAVSDLVGAFYRRKAEMVCDNGCPCPVCNRIDDLDLKVIVHRGEVLETVIAGHHALSGMPVVVAHRLLKNEVGLRHYVLVTEAAQPLMTQLSRDGGRPHTAPARDGIEPVGAYIHELDVVHQFARDTTAQRSDVAVRLADACRKLQSNLKDLPVVGTQP